jgi:hypothetical protein
LSFKAEPRAAVIASPRSRSIFSGAALASISISTGPVATSKRS